MQGQGYLMRLSPSWYKSWVQWHTSKWVFVLHRIGLSPSSMPHAPIDDWLLALGNCLELPLLVCGDPCVFHHGVKKLLRVGRDSGWHVTKDFFLGQKEAVSRKANAVNQRSPAPFLAAPQTVPGCLAAAAAAAAPLARVATVALRQGDDQ
eukprot:5727711-Pleurochrysis_carterae.AAC.1